MIMNMIDNGESLISRTEGCILRDKLVNYIKTDDYIEINFRGVNRITQSFADEFIGKLVYEIEFDCFKNKVKFSNTSDEIKKIIKFAMQNRLEMIQKI